VLTFRDPAATAGLIVSGLAWLALLLWLGRAGARRVEGWRDAWRGLPW
jgi:hypothetical protein